MFNGTATANFASHNADMADAALGATIVTLKGQVNNYAKAALVNTGGVGSLTQAGNTYTLDFGTLGLGAADLTDTLSVFNGATGLADLLAGAFDITGVGSEFALGGFNAFSGLAAGAGQGGFAITFDSAVTGSFLETIVLHAAGSNASGYNAALADTTLVLRGQVGGVVAVPEPATHVMIFAGLLALIGVARARRGGDAERSAA